jgi:predicted HAD superfamily phosphohydrolase
MAGERKRIRDEIKAVVESVCPCEVVASRVYDARSTGRFVSVYFDSGEVQWDGVKNYTTADVVVSYLVADLSDDDHLDEVADAIHKAIGGADIAPGLVQGFIPAGFDYLSEKESAFAGIALRYTVTY